MDSSDIWTLLFDKKITNEAFKLNESQEHLFFLIDMIYYVGNGGVSGFLYNKSPTLINEDSFKPYSKSLVFFEHFEIAKLLHRYNEIFWSAIKKYDEDKNKDFKEILNSFEIHVVEQQLEILIDKIVDNQDKIFVWIDLNKSTLIENII